MTTEEEITMTDTTTTTTVLPQWPDGTGTPVTGDAYAAWLTVSAYYRLTVENQQHRQAWEAAGMPRTGPLRDAYAHSLAAASAEYGLVYLLREGWQRVERLNQLAEGVHEAYNGDTEQVIGYLEDWLLEYDINPHQVADLVEAERAARLGVNGA